MGHTKLLKYKGGKLYNLELIRLQSEYNKGTIGVLKVNGKLFCDTLEPYDCFNTPFRSCIYTGQFECVVVAPRTELDLPRLYVKKVAGRSGIFFHPGNTYSNTKGCILVGEKNPDMPFVLSGTSTHVYKKLIRIIDQGLPIHLTIQNCY